MGRVSLPPPVCDTNLSHRLSFENNNNNNNYHLREASFSSYLNHAEKEFVRKLAESTRDHHRSNSIKTQEDDGDIEVFGAEKYFNGAIFETTPKPLKFRPKRQQQKMMNILHTNHPKTPSLRSESSWNSQNPLLQSSTIVNTNSNASNPTKKKNKKKKNSSQLAKGFLYNCSCWDNKSVESINHNAKLKSKPKPKQKQQQTKTGINFTFQSSIPAEAAKKMQIQVEEQQGRESIEVFGSSLMGKPSNNLDALNLNNLEKKLSTMTWNDIVPRVKDSSNSNIPTTDNPNLIFNDDMESDASSDLFEIESLTKNPDSFLTRQGSDSTDYCVTPTTCYAPSEASIEWSIVTASAADFSVVSDYDEHRLSISSPVRNVTSAAAATYIRRRRSNLLMGCKNQKAVMVAGDKYGSAAEVHGRSESFGRMTRLETQRHATNSLPRLYTPQISSILYV
ncbi:protein PHYTOCHROME KINASE SUBSTRATE 1-like [Cucumis melo]|uniref:Protein PHYTOCHROME KINASE SUBSTRATE 1-like n=1 Tax=Cucumis melo TaxID=3656 RepID=A0A1S3BFN1_CUCME|nr:protein PHYTOCHROME KINASE SUBSTRATE 1-like [Cucumis melo]